MMNAWTLKSLRMYSNEQFRARDTLMSEQFRARDESLKQIFVARDKAIDVAIVELNRRVDMLSSTQENMRGREPIFFTHRDHELFSAQVVNDIKNLDNKFYESQKAMDSKIDTATKPNWPLFISALSIFFTLIAGFYYAVLIPIQNHINSDDLRIEQLQRDLTSHESTDSKRIDELRNK